MANKKFNAKESKSIIESLKEFNASAKGYIGALEKEVKQKEEKVNRISVMVGDIKIPKDESRSTINIQALDIGQTKVRKRGVTYNENLDWEDDFKQKKRGIIL